MLTCQQHFSIFNVARYSSLWKGSLTLYTGRAGHLEKVGEYVTNFSRIYEQNNNCLLLAGVVALFLLASFIDFNGW